ncbi:hypothetical protein DFH28DRAFT_1090374 [Melampsora americana]|nr:hypothetical protein DFH28DRAFT_1090374 [Melampsora americana]
MGKRGNTLPCPSGGNQKKKRTITAAEGSGIIVGAVQASEAQYMNDWIEELELALAQAGNVLNGPVVEEVDAPADLDPDIMALEDNDHNVIPPETQPILPEVISLPDENIPFSNYVQGSYYKSKWLTEKRNWKKNLPDIWDNNFKQAFCCGVASIRTQKVDMLDIVSVLLAVFLPF